MPNTLQLEIVTPEGTFLSEEVESVTLQGADGQVAILPGHVCLMNQLVPGEMVISRAGRERALALGQGLALVKSDRVSVATDMAVEAENIDEAKVEEARRRAAARLREKIASEEVASVNASLARSLAQLHVKRRARKSG
jgi:F-type H+-transporting ATPase subunit epsilon